MPRGRGANALLTVVAVFVILSAAQTVSAATPTGEKVARTVRDLMDKYPVRSVMYGVWVKGRPLATGALGDSRPGVRATKAHHFRIGNTAESLMATLLLQLVDEGRLSLDDPLSNWLPNLPGAQEVTLGMLARNTSGYADYVTNDAFVDSFNADPFQRWRGAELLELAFSQPALFAPGTSWAFSDTNFVLLGKVLRRVGGRPVARLLRRRILSRLGLDETEMHFGARIPPPVIHGYTRLGRRYIDSTRWSPSWVPYAGNMTSTLGDMGRWARALGTGSLLSPESHALQVGPQSVGLGPLTEDFYYGMGLAVTNGWIATTPQLLGYNGVVSYLRSKKVAVVVFTTQGPAGKPKVAYASAIYNRIGTLLAPKQPPSLPVCPRPPC